MRRIALYILALAFMAGPCRAGAETLSPAAKRRSDSVAAQRLAFARSATYHPDDPAVKKSMARCDELLAKEDYPGVLDEGQRGLAKDPYNAAILNYMATAFRNVGDYDHEREFTTHSEDVVNSISNGRNGQTFETAIVVISALEENLYVTLGLGGTQDGGFLVTHGGRHYDQVLVKLKDGTSARLYFDIEIPYAWERSHGLRAD